MAVDVRVDSEQALKYLCDAWAEGLGEGNADARGEDGLVVDGGLDPAHEVLHVDWGGHLGGALVLGLVLPEVFVPGSQRLDAMQENI